MVFQLNNWFSAVFFVIDYIDNCRTYVVLELLGRMLLWLLLIGLYSFLHVIPLVFRISFGSPTGTLLIFHCDGPCYRVVCTYTHICYGLYKFHTFRDIFKCQYCIICGVRFHLFPILKVILTVSPLFGWLLLVVTII